MKKVEEFINSGILEMYVIGSATVDEIKEVEHMLSISSEVKEELAKIEAALETYADQYAIDPDLSVRPFLMAAIDYTERLQNGELAEKAPMLNEQSQISEFSQWISRPDMKLPDDFENYFAKIISYTPEAITAIVWINDSVPAEKHDHEFERFLILEGSCEITVGEKMYTLEVGDYFGVPLHLSHHLKITSSFPCKVILQRVAA